MFKKILIVTALVAIIGVLVFGAVNRTLAKNSNEGIGQSGNGHGSGGGSSSLGQTDEVNFQGQRQGQGGRGAGGNGAAIGSKLPTATPGELSTEESKALIYMREEEKLAHDVYVTMYAQWSLPIFKNVSQSEQTHTEAVKVLIDRYGVADPASNEIGMFTNPELQTLYNELIARGSQSLAEALKVSRSIEEIDILDLQSRLVQTDNADIQLVFNNLLNGSYNHLRAFASALENQTGGA